MANDKKKQEPTIDTYVKLGDNGSIFYDVASDTKVVGKDVVKVSLTPRISAALKGGALVKADKSEFDDQEEAKAQSAKKEDTLQLDPNAGKTADVKTDAAQTGTGIPEGTKTVENAQKDATKQAEPAKTDAAKTQTQAAAKDQGAK